MYDLQGSSVVLDQATRWLIHAPLVVNLGESEKQEKEQWSSFVCGLHSPHQQLCGIFFRKKVYQAKAHHAQKNSPIVCSRSFSEPTPTRFTANHRYWWSFPLSPNQRTHQLARRSTLSWLFELEPSNREERVPSTCYQLPFQLIKTINLTLIRRSAVPTSFVSFRRCVEPCKKGLKIARVNKTDFTQYGHTVNTEYVTQMSTDPWSRTIKPNQIGVDSNVWTGLPNSANIARAHARNEGYWKTDQLIQELRMKNRFNH